MGDGEMADQNYIKQLIEYEQQRQLYNQPLQQQLTQNQNWLPKDFEKFFNQLPKQAKPPTYPLCGSSSRIGEQCDRKEGHDGLCSWDFYRDETFTFDELKHAIQTFLDYGAQSTNPHVRTGWAARCLRWYLRQITRLDTGNENEQSATAGSGQIGGGAAAGHP